MSKLTLDDIADLRAYEREREEFRDHVIALKKKRRVGIGPVVTVVFENRDTVRFQIQEMARAERMLTDEAIQAELDIYNPLVPEPGQLAMTLFIELTDKDGLVNWLPKLVGIERSLQLRLADGSVVRCTPEAAHEAQLTREEITASVHYVYFDLTPAQVDAFAAGPVDLAVDHENYDEATRLSDETREELRTDLLG
ncbi:MAG: fructose-bisphosphate aldolase [Actinomycetia bacterium]|nr:fructose-bisphosphate aldolase [Actinomycetes bacterium]